MNRPQAGGAARALHVAVVGAGWAGCAAAVEAARRGHQVTLLEAARQAGGRARRLEVDRGDQRPSLDNGQHILIGAYRETLALMEDLGVPTGQALRRMPLALRRPDGTGLALPPGGPATLAVLAGVLGARGWRWRDKRSLLRHALAWRLRGFACAPELSVAQLCHGLSARVMGELIEPLCVSALNTPPERASAEVFLRVMRDALFSQAGGADLLLPRRDLSALLPDAAIERLASQGHGVRLGARVTDLSRTPTGWRLGGGFGTLEADAVLLACPAAEAARLVAMLEGGADWAMAARALVYESIATVYAHAPGVRLPSPMLALRSETGCPAQFVFDRSQLDGPPGLLAFVVSASQGTREDIEAAVLAQGRAQLDLPVLTPWRTVVDKRATFACTPGLVRPGGQPLPGVATLQACGDHVAGPYPATLEAAVRSGLAAARCL